MNKEIYHGLFDILLIIVATCSVVITVNDLNSDVTLGKTSAPFTYGDWREKEPYLTLPGRLVHQNFYLNTGWDGTKIEQELFNFQLTNEKDFNLFDLKNWLLTLLPILTVELTFACVPAAEGDQSDDAD